MPILGRETDIFPDDLLDSEPGDPESGGWYAMYTLSRREKELMRRLRKLGIAHYGPLVQRRTRSPAGRIRTSFVPLFAGYVFVRGTEEDRYAAVATGCVSRCLPVTDAEQLVKDLRSIRSLEEFGEDLQAEIRPVVGQRARIVRGPLKDRELVGTICKVNSQHRLTVIVNFLQQGASVIVDEADVELL